MNHSFVWRQIAEGTKALVATAWWLLIGKTNIAQMAKHDHMGGGTSVLSLFTPARGMHLKILTKTIGSKEEIPYQ